MAALLCERLVLHKRPTPARHRKTYERWVSYWQGLIAEPTITPLRGEAVSKSEPEFLDALCKTQQGNYLLYDGGQVIDKIAGKQLDAAADYLFRQLVSRHP